MLMQKKYHSIVFKTASSSQDLFIVLLASVLLGVISQAAVHLWWPVPITFQSAAVILLGLTLGSKRATAAVVAYLIEGAVGLPVFAGGFSGIAYLAGSSGGYLLGFLPAAFLSGFLMEVGMARHFFSAYISAILSACVIFLLGVLHLQLFMGWEKAFQAGLMSFAWIEPLKLLFVSLIAMGAWKED